jgi:hypothetical protein
MAEFSNAFIDEMLDWYTGFANPPAVATRYITVFNGDPTGAGTEVLNTISGSATRPQITSQLSAASGGVQTNNGIISFTASAVAGATVDYVALYTAATGGTLIGHTAVSSKTIAIGDSLTIAIGDLDFAIV